ncbi:unnamed protein product, partial [Mesorhabditis belari]|uniref:Uncharacterized protein n=1 Tax=Mesorhabditis belari TaxID=2138241 RepID=A0AAF3EZ23_9BILA
MEVSGREGIVWPPTTGIISEKFGSKRKEFGLFAGQPQLHFNGTTEGMREWEEPNGLTQLRRIGEGGWQMERF